MIVHRLLDAFFRTLDTIDEVRDRVDRVLGREPRPDPWAVEWPPPQTDHPGDPVTGYSKKDSPTSAENGGGRSSWSASGAAVDDDKVDDDRTEKMERPPRTVRASSERAEKASRDDADAKKRPGRKKKSSSKRKGSVDRSGKDLASDRAADVAKSLEESGRPVIAEEADLEGKKVLARVVWALAEAKAAGLEDGLTTNDISALLSQAAGIEVFATNIGRACRDHADLVTEAAPDGRSKRYILTSEGEAAAARVEMRAS